MKTSQVLLGNLAVLLLAVLAFLQVLSWPIVGYLIIGVVIIATLGLFDSSKNEARRPQPPTRPMPTISAGEKPSRKRGAPQQKPDSVPARPKGARPSPPALKAPTPTETSREEKTREAPTSIGEGDYVSFDVELEKGEEFVGEVSSTKNVNVYVLTEENLEALDNDQEFWYEAGSEEARNAALRFAAPEDGTWFFVVENAGTGDLLATIKINVNKPSRSIPLLRTENLGLPDAKLEGKL